VGLVFTSGVVRDAINFMKHTARKAKSALNAIKAIVYMVIQNN